MSASQLPCRAASTALLSRRQCLQGLGALAGSIVLAGAKPLSAWAQHCGEPLAAGPTIDFQPDAGLPVRERKRIQELSPGEIERLRAAYQAMRELSRKDPSDPRGFVQQAEMHCRLCGGFAGEVHRSWFFLPWHRAFLYFHERILGHLLGDPSFALPVWDWEDSRSRHLPQPYAKPASEDNPLWNPRRKKHLGGLDYREISAGIVDEILAEKDFLKFGGAVSAAGHLEMGPHDYVHFWVGGIEPDMGQFITAARDPIFYPHHAQVDRLWASWQRAGHLVPQDPRWLDERWTFVDEEKQLVSIRVRDVLETEHNLRYLYRPQTPVGTPVERKASPRAPGLKLECPSLGVKMPGPLELGSRKPTTLTLPVPGDCSITALRLERIVFPLDQAILVRLFVELPTANADTDVDQFRAHHLGYFCLAAHFGHELAARHPPRPFDLSISIPQRMEPLLAWHDRKHPLRLTLVPVPLEDTPPPHAALRIEKLSWMAEAA